MPARPLELRRLQAPAGARRRACGGLLPARAFTVLAQPNFEEHQARSSDEAQPDQRYGEDLTGGAADQRGAYGPSHNQGSRGAERRPARMLSHLPMKLTRGSPVPRDGTVAASVRRPGLRPTTNPSRFSNSPIVLAAGQR